MTTSSPRKGVPAVLHAISIFEFLRERGNEPATLTEMSHALEMNPSTCFNILRTLEGAELLARDEAKRYQLGLRLGELGAAVSDEGAVLTTARMRALDFVRRYKLILLLCQKAEDDSFIVLDKLRGRPDPKGTAPLGSRVPPNGAVLAKAYYAHCPEETVDEMLELHGLPARTPASITSIADFKRELAEVRRRGYATSLGEYDPEYNAAGTPVLSPSGRPVLIMVVTGHSSFMPNRLIPAIGSHLKQAAQDVAAAAFDPEGAAAPAPTPVRPDNHGTRIRRPSRLPAQGRARAS